MVVCSGIDCYWAVDFGGARLGRMADSLPMSIDFGGANGVGRGGLTRISGPKFLGPRGFGDPPSRVRRLGRFPGDPTSLGGRFGHQFGDRLFLGGRFRGERDSGASQILALDPAISGGANGMGRGGAGRTFRGQSFRDPADSGTHCFLVVGLVVFSGIGCC